MSIISAILADTNNEIKEKWVIKLQLAYETKDWEVVEDLLEEMKQFWWSE